MAGGFNPRSVLRQTSNGLLEEAFIREGIRIPVNWSEASENDVEVFFEAIESLDDFQRSRVELLLRDIHSLSNEPAQLSIFQQANFQDEREFLTKIEGFGSRHDVALLTYLEQPSIWRAAHRFALADRVMGGRSSQRRINLPPAIPRTSPKQLISLAKSLTAFYSTKQGRGRHCELEYLMRSDKTHYLFATLDNWPGAVTKLADRGGQFERVCQSHAFENVFMYDQKNDLFDIYAVGGKRTIEPLQRILARDFLGYELPPEDPRAEPFVLGVLLKPEFQFATDPEDGVRDVEIEVARVRSMATTDQLVFHPATQFGRGGFQRMIDTAIEEDNWPRSIMQLERVRLRFDLESGHRFGVSITRPNRSNIKSLATEDRLLAEKYLRRWEIDRACN